MNDRENAYTTIFRAFVKQEFGSGTWEKMQVALVALLASERTRCAGICVDLARMAESIEGEEGKNARRGMMACADAIERLR